MSASRAANCDRLRFAKEPSPKMLKRQRKEAKNENIATVRDFVYAGDGDCRIARVLSFFGFKPISKGDPELAHLKARGMGGNPDLSRDTPENTLIVSELLHRRYVRSMHSGHIKVRPLTDKGTRGPCCFEFYEQLPTEIK